MGSKLGISAKRIGAKWKEIPKTALAIAGIIVTVAELADLCGSELVAQFCQEHFWPILLATGFASVAINWDRLEYTVRIAGSPDVEVTLKVCNALDNEGAIIIPTNTSFDTAMEDEFISKGSLQGQYQEKYFPGRIAELDRKLSDGLAGKAFVPLNDREGTKSRRYLVGTVCKVSEGDKRAYFLADSDINRHGITMNVDAASITQALVCLWDSLATLGNQEPYSIPLLGTGKAGVKDLSRDEAVKTIVFTFLAATRDHKVTESLTICVHPSDYEKVNWDDLCEFLKYQCAFANVKPARLAQVGSLEQMPSPDVRPRSGNGEKSSELGSAEQTEQGTVSEEEALVISLLKGNEMGSGEVAAALGVSKQAAAKMLNRLTNSGYIESKGAKRNRVFFVYGEDEVER